MFVTPLSCAITCCVLKANVAACSEGSARASSIDPLAGSFYVESLTDEIEKKALEYIERIDQMGGVEKAIESGYIQQEIADSAYKYQKEVESKERFVVGVNKFKSEETGPTDILRVDPEVENRQKAGLDAVKKERDGTKVNQSLEELKVAAKKDTNLVPLVLECVKNLATLGEISDVLREVFGKYEGGRIV